MDGTSPADRVEVLQARHRGLRDVAAFIGAATAAVAGVTLMAWALGLQELLVLAPGIEAMRVNTAIGVLAAAVAVWFQARSYSGRTAAIALAAALLALLIGATTTLEHLFDADFGLDGLFGLQRQLDPASHPGRSRIDAALSLLCLGLALVVLDRNRWRLTAQILATVSGLLAYFALLNFAFSTASPAGPASYSSMALVSAVCLGLLSLGVALARTEGPVLREVVNFNPAIGATLALLLALLGVTALTWWWARADRERDAQAAFAHETTTLRNRLLEHLARNELVLDSGRSLLGASQSVTREEWRRFVQTMQIESTLPGVLGLGYAPRVDATDLQSHVAAVRRDGVAQYRVWPEGTRALYAPIVYLEPFPEHNRRAIGYDMFSEPVRREAMTRALQTGRTALSARVQLVQEAGANPQPGFLLYAPAYRGDAALDTLAARREALLGFVYSPFRVVDFMRATMEPPNPRVALELHDGRIPDAASLLYRPAGAAFERRARFRSTETLDIGGHEWTLAFVSTPEFERALDQRTPEFILYGGTAISVLVFAIALALLTARRRALALAARRTLELRTTNERLVRQTRDLERSNAELEQFAYVASHDLREPLRTVTSFTQLLEEEHGSALRGDARRYMQYIVDGNRRMQMLIDDLLSLSRVGARTAPHTALAAADAVHEALHSLTQALEESGAEVRVGTLPDVLGDRGQLVQLFQNLIGNALKFRSTAQPRVTISATRDEEWWQFAVADNGIGIERRYFDRIFVIFQRLHGRGEYSGNGIGLAICKKIVERHGGLIWVESEAGQGATFYFTLRAA